MPLISVVISAKDAEKTLAQSLKSALCSDFPDFEVVLVDDGSTDKTWEIAQSIQEGANNLRTIRNVENLGLSGSLNKAIASCDSRYIARLDADDLMMRNRLTVQVGLLENRQEISICGSGAIIIDELGKIKSISPPKAFNKTLFWTSLWRVPFFHPSVSFRRNIFETEGISYNVDNRLGLEDYQIWSQILQKYRGWNFIKPLIFYRKHTSQISSQETDTRSSAYVEISQEKISEYTGLQLSKQEVRRQRSFLHGSFDSKNSLSDIKQSVEVRETCVNMIKKLRPYDESAEIGFGIDLIKMLRFNQDKRLFTWLMSSRFRKGCIRKSTTVIPSYSYFKFMQRYWASNSENLSI